MTFLAVISRVPSIKMSSVVTSLVIALLIFLLQFLIKMHTASNLRRNRHKDCFMCSNLENFLISDKNLIKYICLPLVLLTAVSDHPEFVIVIEMQVFLSQSDSLRRILSPYKF